MKNIEPLFIVLPSYNGASFILDQIESICRQTYKSWHLLIRDDGSTDETLNLIKQKITDDERIELIEDNLGNLGPVGSFSLLIEQALKLGAEYVAFSDQDDIWLTHKLEISMSQIHDIEQQNEANTPILVHTDLEIVTESLQTISSSFMKYEKIKNPVQPSINKLLIQNYIVGCTMIANRSLLQQASPIPSSVPMHDWWLATYAVVSGKLAYIPNSTIQYRQHDSNTLGVGGFSQIYKIYSKVWWNKLLKRPKLQKATTILSNELSKSIDNKYDTSQKKLLLQCNKCLLKHWGMSRIFCAIRIKMSGQNWIATLIFYLLLFFM